MLPIVLLSCVLLQPPAPAATPTPAAPATAPSAVKTDPVPLNEAAMKAISNRQIGRGIGAYYTAKKLMDWVVEANPSDADAVKKLREQWDAEMKPGFDELVRLMAARTASTEKAALAELEPQLDKQLAEVKSKLGPAELHAMAVENRLDARAQPASTACFLYMFDPARAGDDMKLISAGKVRTVRARLSAEGGPGSVLELSVPLSWNAAVDKPGSYVVGENAGMGPLSITVNSLVLPKEAEHDPLKLAVLMAKQGVDKDPPASGITIAGHSAGKATTVIVKQSDDGRVVGLYTFHVLVVGERIVTLAMTVGAPLKASDRDYTRAEFDAYAESSKGVIESVLASVKFADAPVNAAAPAAK